MTNVGAGSRGQAGAGVSRGRAGEGGRAGASRGRASSGRAWATRGGTAAGRGMSATVAGGVLAPGSHGGSSRSGSSRDLFPALASWLTGRSGVPRGRERGKGMLIFCIKKNSRVIEVVI